MKKRIVSLVILFITLAFSATVNAQIDFNNLDLGDILGKSIKVDKGFTPDFYLGNAKIPSVDKLGTILGLKNNAEINRLFKTYKTGRTVYKVATYAGSAIAVYGLVKSLDDAVKKNEYQTAFATAIGTAGTGVLIKLLTKGASYKAVDIFNNTVRNRLKDIFKLGAASDNIGVGLYVKL